MPTIRHDISTTSVVSTCSDCPPWYAFAFKRETAEEAGVEHLVQCHEVPEHLARRPLYERERRRRHAGRS